MKSQVCVLDYGSGNVGSVNNMISLLSTSRISNSAKDLDDCTHIVLPGVGGFAAAMDKIATAIPLVALTENLMQGKPFLGICVGMQVLFQSGEEFGTTPGIGLIEGKVAKLPVSDLRLPHVGWNSLEFMKPHPLLFGLSSEDDFYFTHSYSAEVKDDSLVLATSNYGSKFCAIVGKENIMGVQFHPEKSQASGFKLMKNFLGYK